jgi:hypothetical protein
LKDSIIFKKNIKEVTKVDDEDDNSTVNSTENSSESNSLQKKLLTQ